MSLASGELALTTVIALRVDIGAIPILREAKNILHLFQLLLHITKAHLMGNRGRLLFPTGR